MHSFFMRLADCGMQADTRQAFLSPGTAGESVDSGWLIIGQSKVIWIALGCALHGVMHRELAVEVEAPVGGEFNHVSSEYQDVRVA